MKKQSEYFLTAGIHPKYRIWNIPWNWVSKSNDQFCFGPIHTKTLQSLRIPKIWWRLVSSFERSWRQGIQQAHHLRRLVYIAIQRSHFSLLHQNFWMSAEPTRMLGSCTFRFTDYSKIHQELDVSNDFRVKVLDEWLQWWALHAKIQIDVPQVVYFLGFLDFDHRRLINRFRALVWYLYRWEQQSCSQEQPKDAHTHPLLKRTNLDECFSSHFVCSWLWNNVQIACGPNSHQNTGYSHGHRAWPKNNAGITERGRKNTGGLPQASKDQLSHIFWNPIIKIGQFSEPQAEQGQPTCSIDLILAQ